MSSEWNEFVIPVKTDWDDQWMQFCQSDEVTPIDKTGSTFELIIKKTKKSSTELLNLTTANGGIVLDGANGKITFVATLAQTSTAEFIKAVGKVQYEIYETDTALKRKKIFTGTLTIDGSL